MIEKKNLGKLKIFRDKIEKILMNLTLNQYFEKKFNVIKKQPFHVCIIWKNNNNIEKLNSLVLWIFSTQTKFITIYSPTGLKINI